MSNFILSKKSRFVLYGAASCGTILCRKLEKEDCKVDAFIDQRGKEIGWLMNHPVYDLKQAQERLPVKDVIVIVAVKNVFEHSRIAAELIKAGFCNILYKPYAILQGKGAVKEQLINQWYENMMSEEFVNQSVEIPCTCSVVTSVVSEGDYILEETDDSVMVSIPLCCIFENKGVGQQERNALYFFPHIQFFKYLQGDTKADISYYIDYCKRAAREIGTFELTEQWQTNVIRNRVEICNEMNNAFFLKRDFFLSGAPKVMWNRSGYFNLNSGKHRTAFMVSKGMQFMPVRMSKTDMRIWMNIDIAKIVVNQIKSENVFEIPAPIEHPWFYEYTCTSALFFYKLTFKLAEMISRSYYQSPIDNYVADKKIYIQVHDWGYLGRILRRSGAMVYEEITKNAEWKELLDDLFYLKDKKQMSPQDLYDIKILEVPNKDTIFDGQEKRADHSFYIIPEKEISSTVLQEKVVLCGFMKNEKVCVVYQKME